MAHSTPHLEELNKLLEERVSPVTSPSCKNTTGVVIGSNDGTKSMKKRVGVTTRLKCHGIAGDHSGQENVTPLNLSIDCFPDHGQVKETCKARNKSHCRSMNNNTGNSKVLDVNVNGPVSAYVDRPNRVELNSLDSCIKSEEDRPHLALLQRQKSAANYKATGTDMSMTTGHLSLKTRVSQLLYDNEELNHRFNRVHHKNHVLAVERERLLTTIRNTSAILQSTFSTMFQDKETERIRYPLEEVKHDEKNNWFMDNKSSNSDSLERSTRCTIREFDNLLSALHDRKTKKNPRPHNPFFKCEEPTNVSQYDIIVKWLNNKTTWHDNEKSSSNGTPKESSDEDEDTQGDQNNERKPDRPQPAPQVHSPSISHTEKDDHPDNVPVERCNLSTNQEGNESMKLVNTPAPEGLLPSADDTNQCENKPPASVEKDQLLSKCMKTIDPTTLTLVSVSSQKTRYSQEEYRPFDSIQNIASFESNATDYGVQKLSDKNDDISNEEEPNELSTANASTERIIIPMSSNITDTALPLIEESLVDLSHQEKLQPPPQPSVVEDSDNEYLQNWLEPETPRRTETLLGLQEENSSQIENREEYGSQTRTESTKSKGRSLPPVSQTLTSRATENDKNEFLREWLKDLSTRTQLYTRKTQCTCDLPIRTKSDKQIESNTRSAVDDEHEEFISLCKMMINRMNLMISKSAECPRNDESVISGLLGANSVSNNRPTLQCSRIKTSDLEAGSKKRRKCEQISSRPTLLSQDDASNIGLEFDSTFSSTSSNFSLADLAIINADLQNNNKTNFQMFQKCLANLEEMNIRRTNNALTQTLIIKVLRKLVAKQFKEGCSGISSNRTDPLRATEMESMNICPVSELVPAEKRVQSQIVSDTNLKDSGTADFANHATIVTSVPSNSNKPQQGVTGRILHNIINSMSESIIYHEDLSRDCNILKIWIGDMENSTTGSEPQEVKQVDRQAFLASSVSWNLVPQTSIIRSEYKSSTKVSDECHESISSKTLFQLQQLGIEESESVSILCQQFYLAVGLVVFLLSQFSIIRLFKYFVNMIYLFRSS